MFKKHEEHKVEHKVDAKSEPKAPKFHEPKETLTAHARGSVTYAIECDCGNALRPLSFAIGTEGGDTCGNCGAKYRYSSKCDKVA